MVKPLPRRPAAQPIGQNTTTTWPGLAGMHGSAEVFASGTNEEPLLANVAEASLSDGAGRNTLQGLAEASRWQGRWRTKRPYKLAAN